MFQGVFEIILNTYALIDNNGKYMEVSKKDKIWIENTISNTLKETAIAILRSPKIVVKEGVDEFNGFKIYVCNTHCYDAIFKKGLFLVYSFENDGSKVTLSLKYGGSGFGSDNFKAIMNSFRSSINIINKTNFNKTNSHGKVDEDVITFATYDAKNLINSELRDDLKWLYGVYFNLCNEYVPKVKKTRKKREIKKKKKNKQKKTKNQILGEKKVKLFSYFRDIRISYGKVDSEGNFNTKFSDEIKEDIINLLYDIMSSFNTFPQLKEYFQIYIQERMKNKNGLNIYIWDNRYFDSTFNQGIYIVYSFDTIKKTFSLSIQQGTEFPILDKRVDIAKEFQREIIIERKYGKNNNIEKLNEFLKNKKNGDIIYKNYKKTKPNLLVKDLRLVYNLYTQLCSDYKNKIDKSSEKVNVITFNEYLINKGYFFSKETIENYLLSLKVKPFVILTGNSGTGKTKLSQLFAEYLGEDIGDNHAIVPVGANWTENRNIVGYYNVLTKDYQHTQSLDLILKAQENNNDPYFLILDEMNLSHVERYFSDFLSSMESKNPIPLHKSDNVEDVPQELTILPNLFIIGTVNVDETTYMFSPKVLDRANVLEFKTFEEISMRDYVKNNPSDIEFDGNFDYLENPLSDIDLTENILSVVNGSFSDVKCSIVSRIENDNGVVEEKVVNSYVLLEISRTLTRFNEYLEGSGFEFGYRTVNEILSFMYVAWKYEDEISQWDNWNRYLDAQILQKILPKLHGSQMTLGETIDNLLTLCLGLNSIDGLTDLKDIDDKYPYPDSARKLMQMKKVLEKQRYVSFIN